MVSDKINMPHGTIKGYIDTQDKAINDRIDREVSTLENTIETTATNLSNEISNLGNTLSGAIDATNNRITAEVQNLTNYIDSNDNKLSEKIDGVKTDLSNHITISNDRMTNIENNLGNANNEISSIKGDINATNGRIDILDGKLLETNSNINTINGNINTINGRIDILETGLSNTNNELNNFKNETNIAFNTVNNNINSTNDRIDDLEDELDKVNKKVDDNKADIDASINSINSNISRIDNNISTTNKNLQNLNNSVNDINTQINNRIDAEVSNINTSIGNLDSRINTLDKKVDDLEDKLDEEVARLDGRIDSTNTNISNSLNQINKRIDTVDNEVTDNRNSINNIIGDIAVLNSLISNSESESGDQITNLRNYVDNQINNVEDYINESITNVITNGVNQADKLSTGRVLTVGNTGKTFDGTKDVSWSLEEIGALSATEALTLNTNNGTDPLTITRNGDTKESTEFYQVDNGLVIDVENDEASANIVFNLHASDTENSDGTNSKSGSVTFSLDNSGSKVTANTFVGNLTGNVNGNATSADRLKTARSINGTSFDGTVDITTSKWGTSRNITIGNSTKSVNGGSNVSWTLADIGALPASGGTYTGQFTLDGSGFTTKSSTSQGTFQAGDDCVNLSNDTVNGGTLKLDDNGKIYYNGNELFHEGHTPTPEEVGASPEGHTHKYAGSASVGGVANSAAKLEYTYKVNGTGFNGTADITTANWGTARNISISDADATNTGTAVSVNGSQAYVLKLPSTIKASLSGNASSATKLQTSRTIKLSGDVTGEVAFDGTANATITTVVGDDTHGHSSINIKGTNTISSTSNDTTSNWGAQGTSVHWYTTAGLLNDQPSQWGYILNLGSGSEVHQIWATQSSGNLAHRGGNASGWSGSWRTIIDSSNLSSYVPLFTRGSVGDGGWTVADNNAAVTVSGLAYWNGAYKDTSSNLTYCNHGAFGSIVTKNSGDYATASHGHTTPKSGSWWNGYVQVSGDGVTEVGKYLDFHNASNDSADFNVRLTSNGSNLEASGGIKATNNLYAGSKLSMGSGGSDVYIHNSTSGKYLQLQDNGTLAYSGTPVSLQGHTHDYAPSNHSHNYAPSNHSHNYAPSNHTHDYLPLSGGNLTGNVSIPADKIFYLNGSGSQARVGYQSSTGDTYLSNNNGNWFRMRADGTATVSGKQVVVFDSGTPDHSKIRGGANLSGANGYITFTW